MTEPKLCTSAECPKSSAKNTRPSSDPKKKGGEKEDASALPLPSALPLSKLPYPLRPKRAREALADASSFSLLLLGPESPPIPDGALRAPLKTAVVHPLMPPREPVLYCLKADSIPRASAFHTRTMPLPSPVTSREPAGFHSRKRTPPLLVECAVSLEHTQSSLSPLLLSRVEECTLQEFARVVMAPSTLLGKRQTHVLPLPDAASTGQKT